MNARENYKLTEAENELISAFIDGELDGEMAARVARRIEHDPAWAYQARCLERVDEALDALTVEPVGPEFVRKLKRRLHRRKPSTYLKWVAPLASAACIALVAYLSMLVGGSGDPNGFGMLAGDAGKIGKVLASVPEKDRFVVENLDWLADYEVLSQFETIEAIEKMDKQPRSAKASPAALMPLAWQ
jgi:hypothetical protein